MSKRGPISTPTTIHLVTVVWGEEHTRRFLDLAVPSQLALGNLAGLAALAPMEYHVYTSKQDREQIERSEGLSRIAEHARVRFRELPRETLAGHAHEAMSRAHADILDVVCKADEPVVFLAPELVLSDGSLANVARRLGDGARLILAVGMRLKADVAPTIRERFADDGVITAPARQLARLALSHLHPMTEAYYWDAPRPTVWPANLLWRVGDDGVLAHCFHLHPLVIWPERPAELRGTIDGRFIDEVCSPRSVHVSQDSDELLMVTLDQNPGADQGLHDAPVGRWTIANWAAAATGPQHRRHVVLPIRIHASDLDEGWQRAEKNATGVVHGIMRRVRLLALVLPPWRKTRAAAARNPVLRNLYRRLSRLVR